MFRTATTRAAVSVHRHASTSRASIAAIANTTHNQFTSVVSRKSFSSAAAIATTTTNTSAVQQRAFSSEINNNKKSKLSYDVVPKEDFGQYKEYSVIFTNRALNLMSDPFQKVMRDLNDLLKTTYNADKVAIIPGSG
jgi:hypothetical protein